MITRTWRGWAPADRVHEYEQHYRTEVLAVLQGVAGFEAAVLLPSLRSAPLDSPELVTMRPDALRAILGL